MKTLASHMSQMMSDGRITDGKIYGIQSNKKSKGKRMGIQGVAGTNTGSGSNKPLMGKDAPGGQARSKGDNNQGAVLKAKMPKVAEPKLAAPKLTPFKKAFYAAKNSIQTSTDSDARAAGAKPTKGSTAKTKGAGVD